MTKTTDIGQLLLEAAQGSSAAADALLPLVYNDLRALAGYFMKGERPSHTLQPTALVHEAYMRLMGATDARWTDRAHFLAIASRAMRQVLVEHARRRNAAKRGGQGRQQITMTDTLLKTGGDRIIELLALDQAIEELELLHTRHARVVELRFFGGLTIPETAHVLGVSVSTIQNDWAMTRVWLGNRLST